MPTSTINSLFSQRFTTVKQLALPKIPTSETAMVIFTSGSTGVPKGVFSSHCALTANVNGVRKAFLLDPGCRVFQYASYDFDVSILETYACLASGGCLCIPSEMQRFDDLSAAIGEYNANLICLTPSTSRAILQRKPPSLQTLVFTGEPLCEESVHRWMNCVSTFNWYGPAEGSFAAFCPVIPG